MKVKITGRGGHLWYKDFVGEIVEVSENEILAGSYIAYMVCTDKCSDAMKALFARHDELGKTFPGIWWIYKEDCEVVKEEKPLRVGDVVCFIGSKYDYDHPTITVVKIYMDCRSGYSVFDGVYFNKVTGGYTTIVGASVNAVERR